MTADGGTEAETAGAQTAEADDRGLSRWGTAIAVLIAVLLTGGAVFWVVFSDGGAFCSGDPSPISGEVRLGGGEYVMVARPHSAVLHRPRGQPPLEFVNNLTYVVWLDPGRYRVESKGGMEYRCSPLPQGWVGNIFMTVSAGGR